ncbi:unnamed protein product [Rhodiola kirilowii]
MTHQWLTTLGPIWWDFSNLRMEFILGGMKHILRGVTKSACKVIKGGSLNKLLMQRPQIALLQIQKVPKSTIHDPALALNALISHISARNSALQHLLACYSDLFNEFTKLPPVRAGFDHQIPLEVGANPVNQRPTDYRGLNQQTIKDKNPIPLLEDLLDELGGSHFFSKPDLRAGFYQLRMAPPDVYKTAFKTHSRHYEYLVMPFVLTNAPCTFQGLMNHVFQSIAQKFLLVFFDDILVYSSNWEDHLQHLELVFSILRQQQLYLKPSKCTFGATLIDYLGHFISAEGVRSDPSKIKAVEQCQFLLLRSISEASLAWPTTRKGSSKIIASLPPLTNLLKKEGFLRGLEATQAFIDLKAALSSASVLALPNFEKVFVVEIDASNTGIWAVLIQEHHPICYIS